MDAKLTSRERTTAALRRALEREVLAVMGEADGQAVRWGVDDCALWSVEPARRVLGFDPAARFRGRYRTKRGASRVLGRAGLAGALRAEGRRRSWKPVPPAKAKPGDLGLVVIAGVVSMTVCRAPGWFVVRAEGGFAALPAPSVRCAWSVLA